MTGIQKHGRVASRYVQALMDLAEEAKVIDKIAQDFQGLKSLLVDSDDFNRFVRSPLISREAKKKAIVAISIKAKFQDLTQKFLSTLASNRRLIALPAIIKQFEEEMAARRGEVTAEVTTAHALTDAQTNALKASIKEAIGKDAMLDVQENKEIIGGLIVKVCSVMMDDSVKTKLDRLNRRLKQGTHQTQTKEEVA